jgi:3-oxoadipate enol-lactonase
MPIVSVAGLAFNVAVDGPADAPWLVLSNSLGATLDMWRPQVAAFSRHFRVLRYDTRGHGRSCVPPGPYTIADMGGDVLRLLDHLKIECAHFCGLSMGGTTGIWLGAHAPWRIDRLVLCNTAAWFGPPEIFDARIATVRAAGLEAIADGVMERWFTREFRQAEPAAVQAIRAALLATPVAGYLACCAALRDLDERTSLTRIGVPTLAVAGSHDPAPTPQAMRKLAAAIPGAHYVELPAAHLSNVGAAQAYSDAVLSHLLQGGRSR